MLSDRLLGRQWRLPVIAAGCILGQPTQSDALAATNASPRPYADVYERRCELRDSNFFFGTRYA